MQVEPLKIDMGIFIFMGRLYGVNKKNPNK